MDKHQLIANAVDNWQSNRIRGQIITTIGCVYIYFCFFFCFWLKYHIKWNYQFTGYLFCIYSAFIGFAGNFFFFSPIVVVVSSSLFSLSIEWTFFFHSYDSRQTEENVNFVFASKFFFYFVLKFHVHNPIDAIN